MQKDYYFTAGLTVIILLASSYVILIRIILKSLIKGIQVQWVGLRSIRGIKGTFKLLTSGEFAPLKHITYKIGSIELNFFRKNRYKSSGNSGRTIFSILLSDIEFDVNVDTSQNFTISETFELKRQTSFPKKIKSDSQVTIQDLNLVENSVQKLKKFLWVFAYPRVLSVLCSLVSIEFQDSKIQFLRADSSDNVLLGLTLKHVSISGNLEYSVTKMVKSKSLQLTGQFFQIRVLGALKEDHQILGLNYLKFGVDLSSSEKLGTDSLQIYHTVTASDFSANLFDGFNAISIFKEISKRNHRSKSDIRKSLAKFIRLYELLDIKLKYELSNIKIDYKSENADEIISLTASSLLAYFKSMSKSDFEKKYFISDEGYHFGAKLNDFKLNIENRYSGSIIKNFSHNTLIPKSSIMNFINFSKDDTSDSLFASLIISTRVDGAEIFVDPVELMTFVYKGKNLSAKNENISMPKTNRLDLLTSLFRQNFVINFSIFALKLSLYAASSGQENNKPIVLEWDELVVSASLGKDKNDSADVRYDCRLISEFIKLVAFDRESNYQYPIFNCNRIECEGNGLFESNFIGQITNQRTEIDISAHESKNIQTCISSAFNMADSTVHLDNLDALKACINYFNKQSSVGLATNAKPMALEQFEFILSINFMISNLAMVKNSQKYSGRKLRIDISSMSTEASVTLKDEINVKKILAEEKYGLKSTTVITEISLTDISENSQRAKVNYLSCPHVKVRQNFQSSVAEGSCNSISMNINSISGSYGIYCHLLIADCFNLVDDTEKLATMDNISKPKNSPLLFSCNLSSLNVEFTLPNDVIMHLKATQLSFSNPSEKLALLTFEELRLNTQNQRTLFLLNSVKIDLDKSEVPIQIKLDMERSLWFLPYEYEFSVFLDNMTNFIKSIKQFHENGATICSNTAQISTPNYFQRKDFQNFPSVSLHSRVTEIVMEDDPFDSLMDRNFSLGLDEQWDRASREDAFQFKVESIKNSILSVFLPNKSSKVVEDQYLDLARQKLAERNSELWIKRVSEAAKNWKAKNDIPELNMPPLFHLRMAHLQIDLSAPNLSGDTIAQKIHKIDHNVPSDLQYEFLLGLQVRIVFRSTIIKIRDFPSPLLETPTAESCISGLFIMSEFVENISKSSRIIEFPVYDGFGQSFVKFRIRRSLGVPKFYYHMKAEMPRSEAQDIDGLDTLHTANINFGIALDPHFTDISRRFSTLTPKSADPSPPLPFWDRLRLMFHGLIKINIPHSGGLKLRIMSSMNSQDIGTGLDFLFGEGLEIKVGHEEKSEGNSTTDFEGFIFKCPITVHAGEVFCSIPSAAQPSNEDGIFDHIWAKFAGGILIGFEPKADFDLQSSHHNVQLVSPIFASGKNHDSFKPIRSNFLTFNFFVNAPTKRENDLGKIFGRLDSQFIDYFARFIAMYASPISGLPIKQGKVFWKDLDPPPSYKVGRYIKGINIQSSLENLLVDYSHPTQAFTIGLRARVEHIMFALTLQRPDFIPGDRPTGLDIIGADFDLSDIVVKTVQSGNFDMSSLPTRANSTEDLVNNNPLRMNNIDDVLHDKADWEQMDGFDGEIYKEERLELFASAPKVIYFSRGSNSVFEIIDPKSGEIIVPERDVNAMQVSLLESRLLEIEKEIENDKATIKDWEDRIASYYDDKLREKSEALVEKMAAYFEKKSIIQTQISARHRKSRKSQGLSISTPMRRSRHRGTPSIYNMKQLVKSASSMSQSPTNQQRDTFAHRIIIHNANFIWNTSVRNLLVKFLDLEHQYKAIAYYMGAKALRALSEIIEQPLNDFDEENNMYGSNINSKNSNSAKTAHEMLQKLVYDKEAGMNFIVDSDVNYGGTPITKKKPEDPEYISPEYHVVNSALFEFFYPQVNFQTTGITSEDACVIVSAENTQLKELAIKADKSKNSKSLVKMRRIISFTNAQFFSTSKDEVYKKLNKEGKISSFDEISWPVWVPIECLFSNSADTEEFARLVNRSKVTVQIDSCNPLFVRSKDKNFGITIDKPEGLNQDVFEMEYVDTVFVSFPKISLTANSDQYCAVYDIINNLLIYSDPHRKKRVEDLNTMALAISNEKLERVRDRVIFQQNKIRRLQNTARDLLKVSRRNRSDSLLDMHQNLVENVDKFKQELLIMNEALKLVAYQNISKNSVRKTSRIIVRSHEVLWNLLFQNEPLCEVILENVEYNKIDNEDRSGSNIIQIDKLSLKNKLSKQFYTQVVSPYSSTGKKIDYSKHKMLRVYWRELAPVAGIAMNDHFEINIHPLIFQMQYDLAKALIDYLYPKRLQSNKNKGWQSPKTTTAPNDSGTGLSMMQRIRSSSNVNESSSIGHSKSESALRPRSVTTGSAEALNQSVSSNSLGSLMLDDSSSESSGLSVSRGISARSTDSISIISRSHSSKKRTFQRLMAGTSAVYQSEELEYNRDLRLMKNRASSNKHYVYIKVPGSTHCVSYHGEKEKNIEDFDQFVFNLPTLEFRNVTWTSLEFLLAVKRKIRMAILAETGSLFLEKFLPKWKSKKGLSPLRSASSASLLSLKDSNNASEAESELFHI